MVCYWSGGNHEPCPNMATSRNCTWALGNNKYGLDQLHKPQSCGLEIPELERTSSPESPNDLLSTSYTICTFNYYTLRTGTVQNPFFFVFRRLTKHRPVAILKHWIKNRWCVCRTAIYPRCKECQIVALLRVKPWWKRENHRSEGWFFSWEYSWERERERDIFIYI